MAYFRVLGVVAVAFLLTLTQACIETTEESGYNFRQKNLDNAELHGMERRQIYAHLGSPSFISAVDEEKWYYLGSETARKSVFDPKIKKMQTLELVFDAEGKVKSWREYDQSDVREVSFKDDNTPTAGHTVGVLEQLIGNIGRFSSGPQPVEQ